MTESFNAYYYSLKATGCGAVDAILKAVAWAGKGYHNTEDWSSTEYSPDGKSCVEVIQDAAGEAASLFSQAREQALLEACCVLYDKQAGGWAPQVMALTTPEAQAQARRRVVAGWLENETVKYVRSHHISARQAAILEAAGVLLAALKEQDT